MLRPNKHSNPDQTVIAVAALIIKKLKVSRMESFDKLEEYIDERVNGGKYLLLPALNLLYLLGAIEYHGKQDSFEYIGAQR
jgi:hypothetical protein